MAGINWQQLSPIQAPQVVAQLPVNNAPSNVDSLASGIMGGLAQGQQIAASRQNMAESQQRMEQDKQLFPSQLETSQNAASKSRMEVAAGMRTEAGIAAYQANSDKNREEALKAMEQADPVGAIKMSQDLETLKFNQAQAAKAMTENKKAQLELLPEMQVTASDLVSMSVHRATKPGPDGQPVTDWNMANQIYQQALEPVRKNQPDTLSMFPEKLEPTTALNTIYIGQQAQAAIARKNLGKDKTAPSDTTKRIQEINDTRVAAGKDPLSAEETLDVQNKALSKSVEPSQKMVNNPYDTADAKSGGANMTKIDERSVAYDQTDMAIAGAQKALEKTPGALLNPITGLLGLAKLDKNAQVLVSNLNRLTLLAKTQYNMGSQGFTDADREFVKAINGDVSNYKGTLKELLEQTKSFTEHARQQDWLQKYEFKKKTSDGGEGFLKDHPEPMVRVQLPNGKSGTVPIRQLDKFIKDTKSKVL
jgi:hypothetical protein